MHDDQTEALGAPSGRHFELPRAVRELLPQSQPPPVEAEAAASSLPAAGPGSLVSRADLQPHDRVHQ
jgi:hypothetical protein